MDKGKENVKILRVGDDWHFDIQHIAAQTRYVRKLDKKNNYIIAYLMADKKAGQHGKEHIEIHLI